MVGEVGEPSLVTQPDEQLEGLRIAVSFAERGGGPVEQGADPGRVAGVESPAEVVDEEGVDGDPPAVRDPHHGHGVGLDLGEVCRCVARGPRVVEGLDVGGAQDGDILEEGDQRGAHRAEHLLVQIGRHEPVRRGGAAGHSGGVPGQQGQANTGGPAPGELVDAVQVSAAQLRAAQRFEIVAVQLEVGLGEVDDPPLEVALREPDRWQSPAGEHQGHARGQVVGQRVEQVDCPGVRQHMDVVEQEHQVLAREGGQEPRHEHAWPVRLSGADVLEQRCQLDAMLGDPLDEMATELLGAVVEGLQGDDDRGAGHRAGPGVEQGGLAVAPWSDQGDNAPPGDVLEAREQTRPRNQAGARRRAASAQGALHGQPSPDHGSSICPGRSPGQPAVTRPNAQLTCP